MKQYIINKITKQKIATLAILATIVTFTVFLILESLNLDTTPIHIYNIYFANHTGLTVLAILIAIKLYNEEEKQ